MKLILEDAECFEYFMWKNKKLVQEIVEKSAGKMIDEKIKNLKLG